MHWIYAHLIGDYILQNDWMALNKKRKPIPCIVHTVTYMLPFLLCGFSWLQIFLIALQHSIQDGSNVTVWLMKKKGQARFASPPMAPWSIIVM